MNEKRSLRATALRCLRQIPAAVVAGKSRAIIDRLWTVPEFAGARRIFSCLSFGNEVDTWALVEQIAADPSREVYVPRAEKGDPYLHVHKYPCPLRELNIGLKQPLPSVPECSEDFTRTGLEVGLILGVLFDKNTGYRLGYGGGYFDRFLAGSSLFSIGLALEAQLVEKLPVEPHDVPLCAIVTEERVYRFRDNSASE